ncbi:MAG: RNA polymerase sigma factor [Planctomycetota bacterium]|nr:MAG: RNA polymerase sigma factor [Planctomycetota bacterium]
MMNRDELQELFERHKDDVYRTVRRILRNDADALDATQAAFLNALQALPTLKEAAKFPGWLRRIAVNVALGMRRSRGVRLDNVDAVQAAEAEAAMSADDYQVLKRAVADLPEEYRLPIVLHHAEGFSYDEIARMLDWPRGTVGTNIHRGLERLRTALAGSFANSDRILIALLEGLRPPTAPPPGPETALA